MVWFNDYLSREGFMRKSILSAVQLIVAIGSLIIALDKIMMMYSKKID